MPRRADHLLRIRDAAGVLRRAGAAVSGEAAAHVHLAAATSTVPGGPAGYLALPPAGLTAVFPEESMALTQVESDRGAVADALRHRLDLFTTTLVLADGTRVPVLTREAVLAQLLSQSGLALGLAGTVLMVAGQPPVDPDEVRAILKAACQGDRFQPLLELLAVAA